jgi:peptidoglycan/xylan/chitin deacetylase (PgdA/CDA1 family)
VSIPTPILLYHDVVRGTPQNPWQISVDELARDLDAVLRCGRRMLAASALDTALQQQPESPTSACAVTFDDGYASFADLVMPLLAARAMPVTLYVTTGMLGKPGMLSAAAVSDLAGPQIEVGAHAVRHLHLDLLPGPEVRAEVCGSRDRVAELVGEAPPGFAYPHGSFNRSVRDTVRAAGFVNAYAVKDALSHPDDDPYARARLTVLASTDRGRVERWLAGRGAVRSWRGERLRTTAYRQVRAARMRLT